MGIIEKVLYFILIIGLVIGSIIAICIIIYLIHEVYLSITSNHITNNCQCIVIGKKIEIEDHSTPVVAGTTLAVIPRTDKIYMLTIDLVDTYNLMNIDKIQKFSVEENIYNSVNIGESISVVVRVRYKNEEVNGISIRIVD